jgi:hypothetical protein
MMAPEGKTCMEAKMSSLTWLLLALAAVRVVTWGPDHRLLWPIQAGLPGPTEPPALDCPGEAD